MTVFTCISPNQDVFYVPVLNWSACFSMSYFSR